MSITSTADTQKTIQLKVGKIIEAFKNRDNYFKDNPSIDKNTDERYLKLEEAIITAKSNLIKISPTAIAKFPNASMLPDLAPHASNEIWGCVIQDIEKGLNEPKIDIKELQEIAAPITIKVQSLDKKGNPIEQTIETDDGKTISIPQLEDVQVFAFKGSSLEEVATNLSKLISIANQQTSTQIQEIREELENLPEQNSYDTLDEEKIKKLIDTELSNKSDTLSSGQILKTLASPEAKKVIDRGLTTNHYLSLFDEYMEELKAIHFELKEDGNWYPRQNDILAQTLASQVNYNLESNGASKLVQGTAWEALNSYAFKELQDKFRTHNTNNKDILFDNAMGKNQELNKQFVNLLTNSTDLALRKLSSDNPSIPVQSFNGQLPANKFEPVAQQENYLDRLSNSSLLNNAMNQGYKGVQALAYGQPQPAPQPQPQPAPYLGFNPNLVPVGTETPFYPNYEALPPAQGIDAIPVVSQQPQPAYPKQPRFDNEVFDLSL